MSTEVNDIPALPRLVGAIEEFRKFDPEMQLQTVLTFIHVAIFPGLTMKELSSRVGVAQSSTSRNVASLSKQKKFDKAGHALVIAEEDPRERRRKLVRLTPRGERVAATLREYLK